jgi:hypothetical protein
VEETETVGRQAGLSYAKHSARQGWLNETIAKPLSGIWQHSVYLENGRNIYLVLEEASRNHVEINLSNL